MVNLLKIWEDHLKPELLQEKTNAPKTGSKIDDGYIQASFEFSKSPHVILTSNLKAKKPAKYYHQLSSIAVNAAEELALQENLTKLVKDRNFYNGDHILITGVEYDESLNNLYLEAKKASYAFINTLSTKKFPQNSQLYQHPLYKTGVLVPFITKDDYTFFLERTKDHLYSAVSGFFEPIGPKKLLQLKSFDLVTYTAINEIIEEVLGDANNSTLRINFAKPIIKSLSFRTSATMGTIEFIAPCYVDCHKEYMENIIKNNRAKDANEHTNKFATIPLDSCYRNTAVDFLRQGAGKYPGAFLYHPMLVSATILANRSFEALPATLPGTRTKIIPVKFLNPGIHKYISPMPESNKTSDTADKSNDYSLRLTK